MAVAAQAQQATPPFVVVERGPHHRVWERMLTETLPDGRVFERKSSYIELATGLNYQNDLGEWIESKEEIEIFQGVAVARQGAHQVTFASNLNSPGAIDLLSPDGKRFRSHILGLAYTDYASGQSVLIAEAKDCQGAVLAPNQVVYQDAFAGDGVTADVRFNWTKSAFEQDIILLTAPLSPAAYGFNPETTRLEVFTEFIEAPEALVTPVVLKQESDPVLRQQMAEPDLIDQRLDFGVMKMEQGQAFSLGQVDPFEGDAVPTGKSLERIDGRLFLIEKVDYRDIRAHLAGLPQAAAMKKQRPVVTPGRGEPMFARLLPPTPIGERGKWRADQYAQTVGNRKGLVLDYVTLNSSQTNQQFKAGTTYYIAGTVNLYGTTVIESTAVLKYDVMATVNIWAALDCRAAAYRPFIFTAKDDNTLGEHILGSTGTPTNNYGGNEMLYLRDTGTTYEVHDLHVLHSYRAVTLVANGKANIQRLQVGIGKMALGQFGGSTLTCRNFLFHDLSDHGTAISGTNIINQSEHGTMHRVKNFRNATTGGTFTLTNSLLISVTNNLVYEGANNVTNVSDTGYFQTVAGGAYYLINNSTNRNAGTTGIDPGLLADLKRSTTEPPKTLYTPN